MKSIKIYYISLILIMFCFSAVLFAQSPDLMTYQTVIRDAQNALVANDTVKIRISILEGPNNTQAVYQETHTVATNINGLASLQIGSGIVVGSDSLSDIDWSQGSYFLKTEVDPNGGSSYTITGVCQLVSVPYAFHAQTAESVNITGNEPVFDGWDKDDTNEWTEIGGNVVRYAGNVGIGTASPTSPLEIRASGNNNPATNGLLVRNTGTNDAMVVTQVEDASVGAGDPIFSMGITGSNGWSMGADKSDTSKFKISNKWDELHNRTRFTIEEEGNVGIGTTTPSAPLEIRADGNNNPASNGLLVRNTGTNDAMVVTQVSNDASTGAGDPVFAMGITGSNGWSIGSGQK